MTIVRLVLILALTAAMPLAGCANTVRGIGKDINATADAVKDSID